MAVSRLLALASLSICLALINQGVLIQEANAQNEANDVLPDLQHATTLAFENDIFIGQDSGYTNGIALHFSTAPFRQFTADTVPSPIARVLRNSWMSKDSTRERARVYSLVQTMQTPEDLTTRELQMDQPPYAGMLLGSLKLYSFDRQVVDKLTLTLGIVGPLSLAEESQTLIHTIRGQATIHVKTPMKK